MLKIVTLDDEQEIISLLGTYDKILLGNTESAGSNLIGWLQSNGLKARSFVCFSDTDEKGTIAGTAVRDIADLESWNKEALVVLCENVYGNAEQLEILDTLGFDNVLIVKDSFLNMIQEEPFYSRNHIKYKQWLQEMKRRSKEIIHSKKEAADILMLTPPAWDMYTPFGAVPCLAAALSQEGFKVKQYDIGIMSFHVMLRKIWKEQARRFKEEDYYNSKVKQFVNNPYSTYKEYAEDLWFFEREIFPIEEVKKNYYSLNRVQKGVLDQFYQNIASKLSVNIDFNLEKDFEEVIVRYDKTLVIETMEQMDIIDDFLSSPQMVGISITGTNQFIPGCVLAGIIKELNPEAKIIVGGSCIDVLLMSFYKNKSDLKNYFDYIISGEGETSITQLAKLILKRENIKEESIPNLISFNEEGEVIIPKVYLEEVDLLPPPCFDGIGLDLYLAPETMLPYQSSRGCHYGHCAFCNHNEKYRHNYRTKDMKKVVQDLLYLKERYHVSCFQFVDEAIRPDCFEKMVLEMDKHEEFKEIKWIYYSRVSFVYKEELLQKAKENGCEMVMFGVETFNQRLLNFIKKGISSDASKYCVDIFSKSNIKTFIWLMCNLPSETIEEMRGDIAAVNERIPLLAGMNVGPFYLDVNTDMYRNMEKYNITKYDPYDGTRFASTNEGVEIDKDEMFKVYGKEYRSLINKFFFSNNRYTIFYDGLKETQDAGRK